MRFLSKALTAWRKRFEGPLPRHNITAYLIGEDWMRGRDDVPHYSWPYRLHYTPGFKGNFSFWEGDVRNGFGGFLSAHDLCGAFAREVKKANAEWLIPLLERMVAGEVVPPTEVLDAYKKVYGKEAAREVWEVDSINIYSQRSEEDEARGQ